MNPVSSKPTGTVWLAGTIVGERGRNGLGNGVACDHTIELAVRTIASMQNNCATNRIFLNLPALIINAPSFICPSPLLLPIFLHFEFASTLSRKAGRGFPPSRPVAG